jgi:hypothetical protein
MVIPPREPAAPEEPIKTREPLTKTELVTDEQQPKGIFSILKGILFPPSLRPLGS